MKNFTLLVTFICFSMIAFSQHVGIGITTPDDVLHVDSMIHVGKNSVISTGSTRKNLIRFGDGNFVTIGEQDLDDRMVLKAGGFAVKGGKVGIGVDSAKEMLDVNGNIMASGGLFAGNTTATANGGVRLNTTDGNKMEYREDNTWKRLTKPFYQSANYTVTSAVRNTLILHPTFEYTIPEAGYYYIVLKATTSPVFKTFCTIEYLDNGASVSVYSKTRGIEFLSAGAFKWYIVNDVSGCAGATSIPLQPVQTGMLFLNKNEVMTLSYQMNMYNVPSGTLNTWSASGDVFFLKMD